MLEFWKEAVGGEFAVDARGVDGRALRQLQYVLQRHSAVIKCDMI